MPVDTLIENQLEWDIDAQSLFSDTEAEAIERSIKETRESWSDAEVSIITELAYLLSCTHSVTVVGTAKPAPAVLKMIEVINNRPAPAELFLWRIKLPYKLRNAWTSAFDKAQNMFSVDPAQLPTVVLTPDQQEQLKDKKSFLASDASDSPES